jgi:hypothetical protein
MRNIDRQEGSYAQLYLSWERIRWWERLGAWYLAGACLVLVLSLEFGRAWPALAIIALTFIALAAPVTILAWWMPRKIRSARDFRSRADVCSEAGERARSWVAEATTSGDSAFRSQALLPMREAEIVRVFAVEPTRIVIALRRASAGERRAPFERLVAVHGDMQHCEEVRLDDYGIVFR